MRSDAAIAPIRHALRKQQGVARGAEPSQPGRSQPAWVGPASLGGARHSGPSRPARKSASQLGQFEFFCPRYGELWQGQLSFLRYCHQKQAQLRNEKIQSGPGQAIQGGAKPARAGPSQPSQPGRAKPDRVGPASLGRASQLGRGQQVRAEPACQKIRQPASQGQFNLFRRRSGKYRFFEDMLYFLF